MSGPAPGVRLHIRGVLLPDGEHRDLWVADGVIRTEPVRDAVTLDADLAERAKFAMSVAALEAEIAEGMWHVVTAEASDVFGIAPLDLWRAVLRRQRTPVAVFSTWVGDPTAN